MVTIFPAGSLYRRIDFVVYCRNKTCSHSVNFYRDVKHYGQHMRFMPDHLTVENPTYVVYCKEGLETRVLSWQHLNEFHFVPCLMCITFAKFVYYSNIFEDILYFVIRYSHLQCL